MGLRLTSIRKLLLFWGGRAKKRGNGIKTGRAAVFRQGNYSSKTLSDICEPSKVTPAEHVVSSGTSLFCNCSNRSIAAPERRSPGTSDASAAGGIIKDADGLHLLFRRGQTARADSDTNERVWEGFLGKTGESCTLEGGVLKVNGYRSC